MEHYTEKEITLILNDYQAKRSNEKMKYDLKKDTPEWKAYNQNKSRMWYANHKKERKEDYEEDKLFYTARTSYGYYKKQGRLDEFINRHPDKHKLLLDRHYIKDILPNESIST
tara:strand:+ start:117 stop:455 length:339 start_codon:yes stop_codon:yes gene_type:complete